MAILIVVYCMLGLRCYHAWLIFILAIFFEKKNVLKNPLNSENKKRKDSSTTILLNAEKF